MSPSELQTADLIARTDDPSIEIEVLDANLEPVPGARSLGSVDVELPLGVYAVRFRVGGNVQQVLASVEGESIKVTPKDEAALLRGSVVASCAAARAGAAATPGPADYLRPEHYADRDANRCGVHFSATLIEVAEGANAAQGFRLFEEDGREALDLGGRTTADTGTGRRGYRVALPPGGYRLRFDPAGPDRLAVEMAIPVIDGWLTHVLVLSDAPQGPESVHPRRIVVLLTPWGHDVELSRPDYRWTETALRALADTRSAPGDYQQTIAISNLDNPMLALLHGLLQLRREPLDGAPVAERFLALYGRLGAQPDVLALGWGLLNRGGHFPGRRTIENPLKSAGPIVHPPMLAESWRHILRATVRETELVPRNSPLAALAPHMLEGGPWLVWHAVAGRNAGKRAATAAEEGVLLAESLIDRAKSALKRLVLGAARTALDVAIGKLREALHHDDAPLLIGLSNVSESERRIAYTIEPLLDPGLRALAQQNRRIDRNIRESAEQALDPTELVSVLNLPIWKIIVSSLGLSSRLTSRRLMARLTQLSEFVDVECHDSKRLKSILNTERAQKSAFASGSRTITGLDFLHLRYRHFDPRRYESPPDTSDLAELMTRVGYRDGGAAITSAGLDRELDAARNRIRDRIRELVDGGRIELEGGLDDVLPPPAAARAGELLPRVRREQEPSPS